MVLRGASLFEAARCSACHRATPPLWGLGLVEQEPGARFLHDGRATSLGRAARAASTTNKDAILWHGGEAEAARAAFTAMSRADRDALLAFVRSL